MFIENRYHHHSVPIINSLPLSLCPSLIRYTPPINTPSSLFIVMTLCQVSSIPAALAVLYVSNSLTPMEQVTFFRPLLSHPLLSSSVSLQVSALSQSVSLCVYCNVYMYLHVFVYYCRRYLKPIDCFLLYYQNQDKISTHYIHNITC